MVTAVASSRGSTYRQKNKQLDGSSRRLSTAAVNEGKHLEAGRRTSSLTAAALTLALINQLYLKHTSVGAHKPDQERWKSEPFNRF